MIAQAMWAEPSFKGKAVTNPDELYEASALILWGGEDIATSFYNEAPVYSFSNYQPSRRDLIERNLVNRAKELKIPILGVCRGAQLLCALDGGKLWQHVDNHAGFDHEVELYDGRVIQTNSLHHQMMRPRDGNDLLGWSVPRSPIKFDQNGEHNDVKPEPEVVHFVDMMALGVQGHPEYTSKSAVKLREFTKELFFNLFKVEL
ncbi:gamma-glutamyl-gamma-aminobutyrate hydrolase family protein [Microcystis sp. M42BS1]|uniref:gamma-glutamyl-gamma-aminobutyrate hydrolase family protein n=1 Tax=Microcystis sp. M42BS1 TaxID=2771192 RepID=UPI002589916E|nr:gamma-glutamyl-gamma-aminobutyrate hydrolase family protein [Microcystis sp. M42BS1]MCA2570681.1 gamma-glutamyl-gamma-aminobutyrate hydrolase family protein [Microcystis sp. M42BS1]